MKFKFIKFKENIRLVLPPGGRNCQPVFPNWRGWAEGGDVWLSLSQNATVTKIMAL